MEYPVKYIKEINPNSGNTLVFTFDTEILDLKEASKYFEFLNNRFPKTDILMIPDKCTIKELTPQEIDKYLGAIRKASRRKRR